MKIGILTFFYINNYGAVLQAIALQDYIQKKLSVEVEMIPYKSKNMVIDDSPNPFYGKTLKNKIKRSIDFPRRFNQYMKFSKIIKNFNYKDNLNFNKYDIVIVGSDQVWNTGITHGDYTYFFDIETDAKKCSYAASMGKYDYTNEEKENITKLLKQFSNISVREKEAKEYLHTLGIEAKVVVDPVFLHSENYWNELIKKTKKRRIYEKKYAMYYSLQENEKLISKANQFVEEGKLKVFSVHPHAARQNIKAEQLYNVGPIEFVALIKYSEVVITNSFHALAFAMIFKKKVIFSFHKNTGSRGKNLLELVGIDCENLKSDLIEIDFKDINMDNLNEQIGNSEEYLKNILEDKE